MSDYDRWKTGPEDEVEGLVEECDCSVCDDQLDDDALTALNAALRDCDDQESLENVISGAMCSACRKLDEGDEEDQEQADADKELGV